MSFIEIKLRDGTLLVLSKGVISYFYSNDGGTSILLHSGEEVDCIYSYETLKEIIEVNSTISNLEIVEKIKQTYKQYENSVGGLASIVRTQQLKGE